MTKFIIKLNEEQKAEIPSNINSDRIIEILKIYMFNQEYKWKKISIEEVKEK